MRTLILIAVVATVLAACAASSLTAPASAPASVSEAPEVARPSPSEEAAKGIALLGTFDVDEYNDMFGTDATTATVEGGRIRYVYQVGQVNAEFMIDPNDEWKTILQSSFGVSDILAEPTEAENEAMRTWFRITDNYQREAVDWIREKLDEYLAAPGAEMTLVEDFGDARAGFFTIQPPSFDDPDPLRPASLVGFYVEDSRELD